MTTTEPVVFVVDNNQERLASVQRLSESMAVTCRAYRSGMRFLGEYSSIKRGCLVCGLYIADVSGLQIQRRLLDSGEVLPVILVSDNPSIPTVVRAMQQGAVGFFQSPWDEHDLWENIQHAICVCERREQYQRESLKLRERFEQLSSNERDLLLFLTQGKQSRDIAREQSVSPRTVQLRLRKIMDVLAVDSLVELYFALARYEQRAEFREQGWWLGDGLPERYGRLPYRGVSQTAPQKAGKEELTNERGRGSNPKGSILKL